MDCRGISAFTRVLCPAMTGDRLTPTAAGTVGISAPRVTAFSPRTDVFTHGAGSGKSHGADSIRPRSRHILMRQLAEWSSARRGAERGYQHDLSEDA